MSALLALRAWEHAAATAPDGIEPHVVVVGDDSEEGATVGAYVERDDHDALFDMLRHMLAHLIDQPKPTWIAHCGPAFLTTDQDLILGSADGDLQKMAMDGDERVREVIVATVVYPDMTAESATFVPPLNEPLPGGRLVGGRIVTLLQSMFMALS